MRFQVVVWEREKVTSVFANDVTNDFTIGKNKIAENPRDFILRAISIAKTISQSNAESCDGDEIRFRIGYEVEGNIEFVEGCGYSRELSALMGLIKEFDPDEKEYRLYKERLKQRVSENSAGEGR